MERVLYTSTGGQKSWVGLRDINGEGKYRYIDDNSLLNNATLDTTFDWDYNIKTNGYNSEIPGHCVGIYRCCMYNLDCSSLRYGLCEKKYFSE